MGAKKKGADNRPPIFLAIDKGDDAAVAELLKEEGMLNIRNSVSARHRRDLRHREPLLPRSPSSRRRLCFLCM
jgi:hypothetical protein